MSDVIKYLCDAHRKMDVALRALDSEVHNFEEGETLDYGLVTTALEYLRRTTYLNHHDVEDEIYRRILKKDPKAEKTLQNTLMDHEKLAFLAGALFDAIANVESDNELPRFWLVSVAKEYLNAEWRHIRSEERSLYPAAKKVLDDQDWLEISAKLDRKANMDFVRTEFDELDDMYQDIQEWNHPHDRVPTAG